MDMFRPLIGFVAGLLVMVGVYSVGLLDGVPHWPFKTPVIVPDTPRLRISVLYQAPGGDDDYDSGNCSPRFEFHNHTKHEVAFSANGFDDTGYGTPSGYGPPSGQGYVSTTPDQGGPPPGGNNGQSYGQQTSYGQGYDQQSYGGGNYDQGYGAGGDYDPGSHYEDYDDEYPGPSGAGCDTGVVQVYLDRNK